MTTKSAALFRASNIFHLDYPYEAAVASALRVCDEAVFVIDSNSRDDTMSAIPELAMVYPGRIQFTAYPFTFDRQWQEKAWAEGAALTMAEWLMYFDLDEAILPEHAPLIKALMLDPTHTLLNFPYVHFYGTPDWCECQQFYRRNTRLGRRSVNYRMVNRCSDDHFAAVCYMEAVYDGQVVDAHTAPQVTRVDLPILHYGWVRDVRGMAISQTKHRAWYSNDPAYFGSDVPDVPPFDYRMREMHDQGRLCRYEGRHPEEIYPWLARKRPQYEAAEAELMRVTE